MKLPIILGALLLSTTPAVAENALEWNPVSLIKTDQRLAQSHSSKLVFVLLYNPNTDDEGIKKVKLRDAFETLMGARKTGDTLSKTPVRKKVKRLENITSKNTILPWVTKSGHKGSN